MARKLKNRLFCFVSVVVAVVLRWGLRLQVLAHDERHILKSRMK